MKVIILAGGFGFRFGAATERIPMEVGRHRADVQSLNKL